MESGARRIMNHSTRALGADPLCYNGHQLPSLFLLGAQKCGSTSFVHQIKEEWHLAEGHSLQGDGLGHSTPKELGFFTTTARYNKGLGHYASAFPPCGEHVVTTEGTPHIHASPIFLKRIAESYGKGQGRTWCPLPHRAPSTRCTADLVHHVWHR